MSLQVFLQGQMLGAPEFLAGHPAGLGDDGQELMGRCAWLNLFCEVLPRALLAELRLSRMLLGSSSAEQFLLVLAEEDVPRANDLLTRVAEALVRISGGTLRFVWATTENLGAWPLVRKRLDDALAAKTSAPLASETDAAHWFSPFEENSFASAESYFAEFAQKLPSAASVGWSKDQPAHLSWDAGQYTWPLREQSAPDDEGILFPRRFALNDAGEPASPAELAARAEGMPRWGILKGEVDQFHAQLRRAASIEEHIHLSVLFKEFFAGELSLLCTMAGFWRNVSILYRGGNDFAVIGSWDALLTLAQELERLFERFVEHNLEGLTGMEGKTISMALETAPLVDAPVSEVFREALDALRRAKAVENGTFSVFGRTLEWKRLGEAEELKTTLLRLVRDFGYSPEYIHDLAAVYREAFGARAASRRKAARVDKPWRTHMRLSRVIPQARGKEATALRSAVIAGLIGRRTAALKLRPSARVGLEWARMAAGSAA